MHESWKTLFLSNATELIKITETLDPMGDKVLPAPSVAFQAFKKTPYDKVKVVILGQDPYAKEGLANGLAFSVNNGVSLPPSLKNIYREIERSIEIKMDYEKGDLTPWAEQGVLLLNTALSVEKDKPGSHLSIWEPFMKTVFRHLLVKDAVVFLNFGLPSRRFFERNFLHDAMRSDDRVKWVNVGHPSPANAKEDSRFIGCGVFRKCNLILESKKLTPIDWSI